MTSANRPKTSLRRRAALATAVAVIGLVGAAKAFADPDLVDMQVVDRDTGQPLRVWRHHGRLFIAGEPGERYSLRVTNHTDGRLLVVLSVDGVNIFTGETAGYDQRGYVLYAYQSYDINGWRKSTTEVATFSFAPLPQSYAARTGRPSDVGVIGMAVFTEKAAPPVPAVAALATPPRPITLAPEAPPPPPPPPPPPADVPAPPPLPIPPAKLDQPKYQGPVAPVAVPTPPPPPADVPAPPPLPIPPARVDQPKYQVPAAAAPSQSVVVARRPPDEKLGTAHGERERSVVNIVKFERATPYPQSVQQIEYDTWANLVASGVIPSWANAEHRPRPFPSHPDGNGFVPDPPREP
jgi:hypothetical protein